ncbi:hypothetical protein [Leptolyngbya sp. CCY15150]|uniref:hypothetical protein n=1 Tax=Leptolyngbya sp. CCY15150 TaxID=2767772 RepID=UPI00194EEE3B|nr:hypothetical protein [Leptolyngbya sp. CCY15150]
MNIRISRWICINAGGDRSSTIPIALGWDDRFCYEWGILVEHQVWITLQFLTIVKPDSNYPGCFP